MIGASEQRPISVRHGLHERERQLAAQIYFDAFQRKLSPLIGPPATALPILARSLDLALALAAIRDDTLLGLVGLHHAQGQLLHWRWATLRAAFGWPQATLRYGLALLFTRTPRPGELLLDGIAVAPAARGQGVGSLLLAAAADFGRQHGYRAICLDVIDTNPAARRLYERIGFVPIVTRRYPFMQPFGFRAVTTMRQTLV
jgi:ribosomal protein S18 acetylase RimI-like enzyme